MYSHNRLAWWRSIHVGYELNFTELMPGRVKQLDFNWVASLFNARTMKG